MNDEILGLIKKAKASHNTKNALFLEKYIKYYEMPVEENKILYESFVGRGIVCNPYGIFKEFQKRKDFLDYVHVLVVDSYEDKWFELIEFSKFTNVIFVKYGSDDYLYQLSTSKYLINNCTFPSYFTKKYEQIYINTWHGIANKHLGYDVPNSNIDVGNAIRNFLSADYILSSNSFMTERIYKQAYKLDGIYQGKIIEEGQPRNDLLYSDKEYVIQKLCAHGIKIDKTKKIVLYAPTWRGTLSNPDNINYKSVIDALSVENYQVLVKPHHVDYNRHPQFIPSCIDANELMSVCDVLVTDYSSIYYDWLNLNKPVIFYANDYEDYKTKQGLYRDFVIPYASNLDMLKVYMSHIDDFYIHTKDKLCIENSQMNLNEKSVGYKILDIIFDGNEQNYKVKKCDTSKKKLLFYAGDFKPNGVTTSFLSLLNSIDYSKYDVSVIALKKTEKEYVELINSVNNNARVLCRSGTYAQTLLEASANEIVLNQGIWTDYLDNLLPRKMYQREFNRCFGLSKFDALINFTGYSPFYSYLFICYEAPKYIWLHSDMIADSNRKVGEKLPLKTSLNAVFSTYKYYNKLVSVTEPVCKINQNNFSYLDSSKFVYAHNTIDYKKIMRLSCIDNGICVNKNKINFVIVGRLSYTKNHQNLIKAFMAFNKIYPNTDLYVVGDGELMNDIKEIAEGVECIHFTGYTNNPFYTVKQCDCLVFPSFYEGQGLVALEARVLNKPIVISALPRMKGVFIENGQYEINGFDSENILLTLIDFMDNQNVSYKFDAEQYNNESYIEFEKVIDVE